MITKEQALTENNFHENHDPGAKKIRNWRRMGRTQTWVTRPTEFRIPVKYGMYSPGSIFHYDAQDFHAASECPDN